METATEFKDRLVEYDRESARRTRVVDDQSDFYELDSNAWLSTEVRSLIAEFNANPCSAGFAKSSLCVWWTTAA